MHHVAASRRIERHRWALHIPPNSDKKMQDCNCAVLCNINKDNRRDLRQRAAPQGISDEEVMLADGTALDPPGDGEIVPEAPEWPVSRHHRLCSEGAASPNPDNQDEPRPVPIPGCPNACAQQIKTKNS